MNVPEQLRREAELMRHNWAEIQKRTTSEPVPMADPRHPMQRGKLLHDFGASIGRIVSTAIENGDLPSNERIDYQRKLEPPKGVTEEQYAKSRYNSVFLETRERLDLPSSDAAALGFQYADVADRIADELEIGQPSCPVELRGEEQSPLVFGRAARTPLTAREYKVIKRLIDAWPDRVSKGELENIPVSDPDKVLRKLRDQDALWAKAISMAVKKGRGYGILANFRP